MKKKNLKKILKLFLLIVFIMIILQIIFYIFKTNHKVEYTLDKEGKNYIITETYKDDNYYLLVETDDYKFSLETPNTFNKRREIVKDIKYFEYEDYKCIYIPNTNTNIVCSDKTYNYSYNMSQTFTKSFVNELKELGYSSLSWDEKEEKTERIGNANVYKDNLLDNSNIYVYKYNGIYSINKEKLEQINILANDNYNNTVGVVVDKYYVMANYDDKYTYNKLYIIDMTNNRIREMELKTGLSKDTTILGVIDNKLYLFDPDSIIEYELDVEKRTITEIGNKDINGKYYDGLWQDINIYDFKTKKIVFEIKYDFEVPNNNYLKKYLNNYYYQIDENIYSYNEVTEVTTMLLSLTDITNITLVKNDLYFIKADTIYLYHDGLLSKILTYDELNFNSLNRYFVYEK